MVDLTERHKKTIPVAIPHFEQTVTVLLIDSRLDISTAPRSLLEETVIPRSLLFFIVIHLTEMCRNCRDAESLFAELEVMSMTRAAVCRLQNKKKEKEFA